MKLKRTKKSDQAAPRRRVYSDDISSRPLSAFSYRGAQRVQGDDDKDPQRARREVIKTKSWRIGRYGLQRFGIVVLLCAVLVSLFNVLTLSTTPVITELDKQSGKFLLRDPMEYQTAAQKLISSSIWNRNKITIDAGKISKSLEAQFPELSSVSVTLPFLAHKPVIYVQPAEPALVLIASNGSYIVDTTGKALLAAQDVPTTANLDIPTVTDQSNVAIKLNQQALTQADVGFIQAVVAQLAAKGQNISTITLPSGVRELDVQPSGLPYFGKFNLQTGDARQQVGTFLATQAQLQQQKITPAKYIDVRVEGRAYYQ